MTGAAGRGFPALTVWLAAAAGAWLLLAPLGTAWDLAPDLGHGWAAPLLIAYLYWERWPERPVVREQGGLGTGWWILAAAVFLAALPLQLLLAPYPLWPALVWAYVALLLGVALAAAGRLAGAPGVRWLGGPLVILAGAVPWLVQIDQRLIFPLREGIAGIAAEVCNLLGRPALSSGTTVHLGSGWVGVDEACGGIRSLQAAVMIALFFGEWFRFSWPRRAALAGLGVAAALLGNFCRVVFLALQATRGAAAFYAVHDAAGWLALAFSLALTGLVAWRWARRRGPAARPASPRQAGGDVRPVGVWLCVVAGLLFLDSAAVGAWYALGEAGNARLPHWTVRMPTGLWSFRPAPLAEASREMLLPDFYEAGSWQEGDSLNLSAYYIEWRHGSAARFIPFLHNPTVCLPRSGCELVRPLGVIAVPWNGGVIPFHGYIFREAGQEMAVAFTAWDTARNAPLERPEEVFSRLDWFRYQWRDVREARRSQPAQMLSVAILGKGGQANLARVLRQLIVQP
jgi:exosortase